MSDPKHPGLADDPIDQEQRDNMQALARGIDEILNGNVRPKPNGFILLTFSYADFTEGEPRANYISNGASRADIIALMRELIGRWEAQTPKGTS